MNRKSAIPKKAEISFATAEELINCLLDRRFSTAEESIFTPNRWVFRGHANSDWTLQPTAFRDDIKYQLLYLAGRQITPDGQLETTQIFSEYILLFRFYKQLEKYGLSIPDNSPELREIFEHPTRLVAFLNRSFSDASYCWPPSEIHGLIALAQHYGLPTRLLDWTNDPLVACHFAAQNNDASQLAIWCLDTSLLSNSKSKTSFIYVATASNPNLLAQQGLFTVSRTNFSDGDFTKKEDVRPLEERLYDEKPVTDRPSLYKLIMSRECAAELKRNLHRLNYTTARMVPGYEGVVKEMNEGTGFAKQGYKYPTKFDCYINIFIPENSHTLGQAIAAVVDPDTGGYKSFGVRLSHSGNEPSEYRWCGGQIGTEAIAHLLQDVTPIIPGLYYHISGGEGASIFSTNIHGSEQYSENIYSLSEKLELKVIQNDVL